MTSTAGKWHRMYLIGAAVLLASLFWRVCPAGAQGVQMAPPSSDGSSASSQPPQAMMPEGPAPSPSCSPAPSPEPCPEWGIKAKVSRVSPVLDTQSRTRQVEVDLDNPDGRFVPCQDYDKPS